jgi:hypothetical protein
MKAMAIGSCRIYYPVGNLSHVKMSPLGNSHSSGQIIQLFKIMNGTISIPEYLTKMAFKGRSKTKEMERVDISKIDKFIIEVSSLKKVYFKNSKILLSLDYFENRKISEVITTEESDEEFFNNLDAINRIVNNKPILFVSHNNIPNLINRSKIIMNLSKWCKKNKKDFFDPTHKILQYKPVQRCFLSDNDYNHYSVMFIKKLKKYFRAFLKGT